jgi:hypothetical protein
MPAHCSPEHLADYHRDLRKVDRPGYFDRRGRLAVAALLGECEAIVECGLLPEQNELALRLLIADALAAFEMPSKAEREAV